MSKEEIELKIVKLKSELPMLCDSDYYKQCEIIRQLELELESDKE